MQELRVGLNYKPGDVIRPTARRFGISPLEVDDWSFTARPPIVSQYAPPFHAPYSGANSLDSNAGRETWDATLYVGRRLWEGAELWIDPEIDQGFGLSNTLGVAGFPSGEAYKVGFTNPYLRLPRVLHPPDLRSRRRDRRRWRPTSTSSAAHRPPTGWSSRSENSASRTCSIPSAMPTIPRNDFLNWSLVDAGTFDYAADAWGFTYGAAAEWYQGNWTLRAGLFDLSIVPNSIELDRRSTSSSSSTSSSTATNCGDSPASSPWTDS